MLYQSQQCWKQSEQGVEKDQICFLFKDYLTLFIILFTHIKYDFTKDDAKTY